MSPQNPPSSPNCLRVAKGRGYITGCKFSLHTLKLDKDMEERGLSAIGIAHKKIKLEIHDLSERVKNSKELIQQLKEQIEQAEENG